MSRLEQLIDHGADMQAQIFAIGGLLRAILAAVILLAVAVGVLFAREVRRP